MIMQTTHQTAVGRLASTYYAPPVNSFSFGGNLSGAPDEFKQPLSGTDNDASKPRALIVDDAPDVAEMIAMLLQHTGYTVATAFSANDALATAESEHFDIIISDIGMPGMNGYDLAEALRRLPDYAAVPLVAVTGFSMYDDRERALSSGFNAFLSKPINPLTLLELIDRLCD